MVSIRRISLLFLWIIPLPFLTAAYQPGALRWYVLAGALQGALIAVAAWRIRQGPAATGRPDERRNVLVASALLVSSWAVASLALNMNDPPAGEAWLRTQPDQHFRYAALVAGYWLALGGLAVLAVHLLNVGDRLLSALALIAAAASAFLFTLLFLPYPQILTARFTHEAAFGATPDWWPLFRLVFSSTEVVQRLLAYVAMFLFAIALRRARLLSARASVCLIALTALAASANAAVHIPPAVPLVLPYVFGVVLMHTPRG